MGSLKKKLRPPGKSKVQKLMSKSPVLGKLAGLPGAPPMPGMGGKGGKKMAAPMDPRQQAMAQAQTGYGGALQGATPPGATPPGFGATTVGTTPQMESMGMMQPGGGGGGMADPNAPAPTGPASETGLLQPGQALPQGQGMSPEQMAQLQGMQASGSGNFASAQQVPQGPVVPGGGGGPSPEAQQMMQAMAQAKALRQPLQPVMQP